MNIKDIKDKYKNTNLYKQMILKSVLSNKKTNIFGGFYNCYVAYDLENNIFCIYKHYENDKFANIKIYEGEMAEICIDETLDLIGAFADYKDTEKFIALKFHKDIEEGINHNEK